MEGRLCSLIFMIIAEFFCSFSENLITNLFKENS